MPFETDEKHFPPDVLHLLRYQGERMKWALHGVVPPDRKEAKQIQKRVDAILDRRPRNHTVAPDGEIVWGGTSSWIEGQTLPSGAVVAVNSTGQAESLVPNVAPIIQERPRPTPLRQLTREQEADINRFGNMLQGLPEAEK